MNDRSVDVADAAESCAADFPPNPLIDTDTSHPLMAISETAGRVRDVIALLDHLDYRDELGPSAAAGMHWAMEACMDALQSCKKRLQAEVRRHG